MTTTAARPTAALPAVSTAPTGSCWPTGKLADAAFLVRLADDEAADRHAPAAERIAAAWIALGPNPTEISRVVAVPTAQVLATMGRAVGCGLTRDDGTLRAPTPDRDGWSATVIAATVIGMVLDGTAVAAPDPDLDLIDGTLAAGLRYQLRPTAPPQRPQPPVISWATARNLLAERIASGTSLGRLAAEIQVFDDTLERWLTDPTIEPRIRSIEKVSRYLGVTIRG